VNGSVAPADKSGTSGPKQKIRGPRLAGRVGENGQYQEFALGQVTTLGRHPANTLRLADREVSKEHASIERVNGGFMLRDLESSNGTFVNGRRVKELRLRDGDEISLGGSRLIFQSGEGPSGPASTGVTVVASANSIPAFLAQIAPLEDNEFRPADQISDLVSLRQDYEKLRIATEFHRMVGMERDQRSLLDKILKVASSC
jgi:adenylate cyclase